ncbi:mini-chromosome maintenance complex-binding protein isoform X2 [Agrilus planipennis]|uniref:Mini-chromosome maintenance complex-binding protein n=1 Tax=Agrilus planipennis TaxID=224129 RepID=A0A1W4XLQ7_AGRPL|nr:mini-chromosome maintenance complex-binding protein isoform X2 [Agrilus planipennis]
MSVNIDISQWTPEYFNDNESECLNHLLQDAVWNTIPLVNIQNSHYFQDMRLVRFRGMIQDMHDPEFYFEKIEISKVGTDETCMRNGKYVDVIQSQLENQNSTKEISKGDFASKSVKRTLEVEEMMEVDPSTSTKRVEDKAKKLCSPESNKPKNDSNEIPQDILLNYPIPKRAGKTCLLKIYNDSETLKLNEMIEFVGFLSTHPMLSEFDKNEFENDMEVQVHHPPASLIPRIHCVSWKKLQHSNPMLHDSVIGFDDKNMYEAKKELLLVLTSLLLGDELAAEYLICHLISKIYMRADLLALGKFSLNISNVPIKRRPEYVKELYSILELFLPKSHYLEMSISNINEAKLIPKKNYDYNRLNSGLLQLSPNTHLVVDETLLTTGQLNSTGVHNVRALSNVIRNQKTEYDFVYYQMEYECDIPILILSEEKSLLPSDFQIPLQPADDQIEIFPETVDAIKKYLKPEILNKIRIYLTNARHNSDKYELPQGAQEVIEEEFIQMRKAKKASADDLHNLLVLARLKCLSDGKTRFDDECWKEVCQMENIRKERIEALKNTN